MSAFLSAKKKSFSVLKSIKSYLRSSMSEQRLTDMAVERDLADSLVLNNVIEEFTKKNRRIILS